MTTSQQFPATIPGHLFDHAVNRGQSVALHVLEGSSVTTLTWEQLLRQSCAYADWYRSVGVQAGDVVILCMRHSPTMYPAHLGAMLAGAIPSFVSFPTPKQDPVLYWDAHRVLFDRVRPAAVLTYADNAPDLHQVVPDETKLLVDQRLQDSLSDVPLVELAERYSLGQPDSVALLQHSSGTTGHKKGVMLTHRKIELSVRAHMEAMDIGRDDPVASWLPLYHDMGLIACYLAPVIAGATTVSYDAFEWVERPHMFFEVLQDYRCTVAWLPNFAYNHLIRTKQGDETYDVSHLRVLVATAEPVKVDLIDRFVDAFSAHGVRPDQIVTAYGGAEVVCAATSAQPGRSMRLHLDATSLRHGRAVIREPGPGTLSYFSNGPVLPRMEIRVDPSVPAGDGEGIAIGELQFRGDWVYDGYYNNEAATAAAFDGDWFRMGDLGCVIDGEVFVLGRTKDVIIHHGVNYYAHDLEAVASAVSGVKPGRCAALAVYDDETASERVEFVAERDPDDRVDDAVLRRELKHAVADRFNITVARVHLVEPGWLVKTTSGKVSRSDNLVKLREHPPLDGLDDAEYEGDVPDGTPADVPHVVLRTIATTFNVPMTDLTRETTAPEVDGWDSLGHTVLLIRLSNALGIVIPEDVAANADNVGDLIDLIEPLAGANA